MPFLNGHEVRLRAAEMASAVAGSSVEPGGTRQADHHIRWLAQETGIPVGTLHNATREHPQVISLSRVLTIAALLKRKDERVRDTVAAIIVEQDEDPPKKDDEPDPVQDRPRDPSGPPGRPDRERKGPPRSELAAAS